MKVIGVDGYKSGWIAVVLNDGDLPRAEFAPTIGALDVTGAASVASVSLPTTTASERSGLNGSYVTLFCRAVSVR